MAEVSQTFIFGKSKVAKDFKEYGAVVFSFLAPPTLSHMEVKNRVYLAIIFK